MSDELDKTIKLKRNSKVGTDSRGRNVWTKPIEPTELELVSTVMLQKILATGDESQKKKIREAAEAKDGVLAKDSGSNEFEIITEDELEAAIAAADSEADGDQNTEFTLELVGDSEGEEELSLVTTQALRKIFTGDEEEASEQDGPADPGGYNPYDSS